MDGGNCYGGSMFLQVKESQIHFLTKYNNCVLLNQRQKLTKGLTSRAFERYLIYNGNKIIHVKK